MNGSGTVTRVLAFLVFPAVVAVAFWDSGVIQIAAVFILMMLVDALIIWVTRSIRGTRD